MTSPTDQPLTSEPVSFLLHDETRGETWSYDSERQLRTVTTLYATQHPQSRVAVTIGATYAVVTPNRPVAPVGRHQS